MAISVTKMGSMVVVLRKGLSTVAAGSRPGRKYSWVARPNQLIHMALRISVCKPPAGAWQSQIRKSKQPG